MTSQGCDHDFRIAQLLYDGYTGGTVPFDQPSAALVVCRKCGDTRRSVVGRIAL